MNYLTEFKIQQLRTRNLTAAVESTTVILGAVVTNMLIPQLLLKYVYTDPSSFGLEAPAIFTYLPLVTYSIALVFFAYSMVNNFLRAKNAKILEQELFLMGDCCGDECCNDGSCHTSADEEISEEELKELEKIVDEALKPSKKSKKSAKTTKSSVAKKKTTKNKK